MASPERAAITWVRQRGISRALAREACARGVLFCALLAWNPLAFACYWLALRACVGGSSFVFHHLLHSRGGALGNFALPRALLRALPLARALFGIEPVLIVRDHRLHHAAPGVRARDLPTVERAWTAREAADAAPVPALAPLVRS